jgi:hypothetical protein
MLVIYDFFLLATFVAALEMYLGILTTCERLHVNVPYMYICGTAAKQYYGTVFRYHIYASVTLQQTELYAAVWRSDETVRYVLIRRDGLEMYFA